MTDIQLFFEDPTIDHKLPRKFSTLYLLRRDISVCFGINIRNGSNLKYKALWPGAMAILAGIDLLGKFYAGYDTGSVGMKFKNYIGKYFISVSGSETEIIYQLRNSLLHSFGLYSKDNKNNKIYRFVVDEVNEPLVKSLGHDKYKVDLITLNKYFEASIANYKIDLMASSKLQGNFKNMFPNYGYVNIW